jgi:type I restriction enzyme S subunit
VIAGIKPYPVYRDPGLVWLDRVPAHWSTRRMKFLFRQRRQRGFPREPLLAATQTKGVVRKQDYEARTVTATAGLENLQLVEVDDFVISLRSFQGGIEISHARGIISPAYTILTAARSESRDYFRHLFKSAVFIQSLRLFVTGIREGQTIDYERLGRAFMPLPPPEEQAVIARFLDHVGGQIERAIRAKRKVIALLQEQKQSIIQRAVTSGMTQSGPLKEAGVPWLGSFPAHWELRRMSSLATFSSGKAHEHFVEPDGEHICVTARFVSTGGASGRRCTRNFSPAKKGDVLMVMSDLPHGRALARAYLVRDHASYAVNQRVCILRPSGAVDPEFLALAANRNPGLLRHDDGSNQTHLSNGDFKTLLIQYPPLAEQHAIVASIRGILAGIDQQLRLVAREVDLLQEFRTRLVADVVTGKLDVREAAAGLPAEPAGSSELTTGLAEDPIDEEAVVE